MHTPWPGPASYDAAPLNTSTTVHAADWTILDRLPVVERFPNAADLAELWTVIRSAQRGER